MAPLETPTTANRERDLSSLRMRQDAWQPSRQRRLPAWLVAVTVLLGTGAVLWRFAASSALMAPEVRIGQVVLERPSSGTAALTSSGYVIPRTKASVSVKMAGRLEWLAVEEGDKVEQGQVLARIEHRDLDALVAAGEAEIAEARARLEVARSRRDQAARELARQKRLVADEVGSQQAYDAAESEARTTLAAAGEAEAAITTAQARLSQSQVSLEDAFVRAPFAGTILRKEADVGESVAPAIASGQTTRGAIVTMADLSALDVEADVSETNIARVKEGQPAEVALDAIPDRRFKGRVRQILPTADRDKATVKVKVAIEDPDDRVKPEMSAKVTLLQAEIDEAALKAPPVLTAPKSAIVVRGSAASAFVLAGGKVERREVTVGEAKGERVVVTSGLKEGDGVVLDPPPDLESGDSVKVKS